MKTKALTVALEIDMDDDAVRGIIDAMRHIRGVAGIAPVVVNTEDWVARVRATNQIGEALAQTLVLMRAGNMQPRPE